MSSVEHDLANVAGGVGPGSQQENELCGDRASAPHSTEYPPNLRTSGHQAGRVLKWFKLSAALWPVPQPNNSRSSNLRSSGHQSDPVPNQEIVRITDLLGEPPPPRHESDHINRMPGSQQWLPECPILRVGRGLRLPVSPCPHRGRPCAPSRNV